MEIDEFTSRGLDRFCEDIIDRVFLLVENDEELMRDYLRLLSDKGLDVVNRSLGGQVKKRFGVESLYPHDGSPKSLLIKSYTGHK